MSEQTPTTSHSGGRAKGIVAIVAGAALLVGGTGTFAYWSTQQSIGVDDVQAGDLDLALGAGSWTLDGVLGAPVVIAPEDIGAVRLVPGDVLTLEQELDVTLIGDTIAADLAADAGAVVPPALTSYVTVTFDPGIGTPAGTNTVRITPTDSGTVTAELTISFSGATPNQIGVNETLDLSAVAFTLTQADS